MYPQQGVIYKKEKIIGKAKAAALSSGGEAPFLLSGYQVWLISQDPSLGRSGGGSDSHEQLFCKLDMICIKL